MRLKQGWMDSIDFDHELGHACGGNSVHPSVEDCERCHPCIEESKKDEGVGEFKGLECYAKRVYVVSADEFDMFTEHLRKTRQ